MHVQILAVVIVLLSLAQTAPVGPPVEPGPFKEPDLVDVRAVDPTLRLDVRYATANNFLGRPVYKQSRAFLQRDVARALAKANAKLRKQGYGIVVFDGYRPWSVTKVFWDETPADKHQFVADPANGSRHNRGAAVDVSLFDLKTGQEVAMPSPYDDFTEAASPTYAGGTPEARRLRDLLRAAMEDEGFAVYEHEWWHFDYKDWREYPILNVPFEELDRPDAKKTKVETKRDAPAAAASPAGGPIEFLPFSSEGDAGTLNASGVVPIGDSRFLFCDNNTNAALFELRLDPASAERATVVRRPIAGLPASGAEDMEDVAVATENGRRYIFVTTSLGTRAKKGAPVVRPGGLVRITEGPDGALTAETITGFREWLMTLSPVAATAGMKEPDAGGLNVEGLTWDPTRHALLVGLRSPQLNSKPVLLPVRIKDLAGAWAPANFEMLEPIVLDPGTGDTRLGVRDIEYDENRKGFLVLLGRSLSGVDVPFAMYLWDGNGAGTMRRFARAEFVTEAKPEGIAGGVVAGRQAVVVLDDNGGYQVLYEGDPRLQL